MGLAVIGYLLLRPIKQPIKNSPHVFTMSIFRKPKLLAFAVVFVGQITEAAGERFFFVFAFRNRVAMRFLHHLHFVLHLAQKTVGIGQLIHLLRGYQLVPGKLRKRPESVRLPQSRLVTSIYQLQGLGEELDLTNPAVTEFNISSLSFELNSSFSMRIFMCRSSSTVV